MMGLLHLTLTDKWFDKIASGRKRYEFREVKPYNDNLIGKKADKLKEVRFVAGYRPRDIARVMYYEILSISIRAYKGKKYYVIELGKQLHKNF
ncbi:hypothetical protein QQ054_10760 [Oscillatoria amoena NRMC-F 0135]|nr:hypothetical protein [Oscillatoria amoena NRMC-F 0135]